MGLTTPTGAEALVAGALERFGTYRQNEVGWDRLLDQVLKDSLTAKMSIQAFKSLVGMLVDNVQVTKASFWDDLTNQALSILPGASLEDLMDVAASYAKIRAWSRPVFQATIDTVRREMAVHTMDPKNLVRLLDIFSRAGRASHLSRMSAQLFNEMQDRILEDVHEFTIDDSIAIVESMARFRAVKLPVLQVLGREHIHPGLPELSATAATDLCAAYGELGWRHDTSFKEVATRALNEQEELQRARLLGASEVASPAYTAAALSALCYAMLQLKMNFGNTSWFRWADSYEELVAILERRVEDEVEEMQARPLAAAAYVLGRAHLGSESLCRQMYQRFMRLLELSIDDNVADEPPQYDLARFLHGLTMMGPSRKKDLDASWLMLWLCQHVDRFVLSDFVRVNRHLVAMGCCDTEYLRMLAKDLFSTKENVRMLTKSDIMDLSDTFNSAGLRDEHLGRHLFWVLGRRFQKLQAESAGSRSRPAYKRIA